jgi:hypothetical protein
MALRLRNQDLRSRAKSAENQTGKRAAHEGRNKQLAGANFADLPVAIKSRPISLRQHV